MPMLTVTLFLRNKVADIDRMHESELASVFEQYDEGTITTLDLGIKISSLTKDQAKYSMAISELIDLEFVYQNLYSDGKIAEAARLDRDVCILFFSPTPTYGSGICDTAIKYASAIGAARHRIEK